MRRTKWSWTSRDRRAAWVVAVGVLAIGGLGMGQPEDDLARPEWTRGFGGESTFTEPSRSSIMGFDQPTSITEVLVRGGQRVAEGELMVRGDDAEEVARYEAQQLKVRDNLEVQRLQKIADLRQVQYERTKASFEEGAGSRLELDERRVTMEVAQVELEVGKTEFEQAKVTLDMYEARVDRLRLHAPFEGIVEKVQVDVGQSVGEEDPVLRVVNTDALRMDVAADTNQTLRLGLDEGDPAWVLVDAPGEPRVYLGRITEVSPVAYYATRQRRVRVEVDNPEGWPAGLPAWVRFTEPTGEWAQRVARALPGEGSDRVSMGEPAGSDVSDDGGRRP